MGSRMPRWVRLDPVGRRRGVPLVACRQGPHGAAIFRPAIACSILRRIVHFATPRDVGEGLGPIRGIYACNATPGTQDDASRRRYGGTPGAGR